VAGDEPGGKSTLRLGDVALRHDDVVAREQVFEWFAAGHVWDTAQGWFVNERLALIPAAGGYRVVDLARLRDSNA
jgi:hypothetical protein